VNAYSERLDRALALAARAHRDQKRKGSDVPYVQHPAHVAILLVKHGFAEDVVIAGVLHDVVEDTDVPLETIRAGFGDAVAALVAVVSEQKMEGHDGAPRSWHARKADLLAAIAGGPVEAAAVKAADALHNCATTVRDVRASGDAAWARFNAGRTDQIAWYRGVARMVRERLGGHAIAVELEEMVETLASI
jgi:(p)ppGpp synthase/HD superfamily hydrolase